MRTLEVNGKTYSLRIYSKFIAGVQEKLPENKPFAEAIVEAGTDPVKHVVPFLWGIIQDRKSDTELSMDAAYELYDDLVDAGYSGFKFAELLLDICTASGFFDESGEQTVRTSLQKIKGILGQAGDKLLKTVQISPSSIEKQQKPISGRKRSAK